MGGPFLAAAAPPVPPSPGERNQHPSSMANPHREGVKGLRPCRAPHPACLSPTPGMGTSSHLLRVRPRACGTFTSHQEPESRNGGSGLGFGVPTGEGKVPPGLSPIRTNPEPCVWRETQHKEQGSQLCHRIKPCSRDEPPPGLWGHSGGVTNHPLL